MRILHESLCRLAVIYCSLLLRTGNILDKTCREYQNTNLMSNNFFSENSAVYEVMWKNMLQPERQKMKI